MSQIFKYPLEICDARITHHMPKGARPLCVQNQGGILMLWAIHDFLTDYESRSFVVVGTGQNFDARGLRYVGTAQVGSFVWHVFEVFGS